MDIARTQFSNEPISMNQIFDEPISMNWIFNEPILMSQIFDEPAVWWTRFIELRSTEKHGSMNRTLYEHDTTSGIAPFVQLKCFLYA